MDNGVKQGIASALICVALMAVGVMVGSGVDVGETQEQVGRILTGAGLVGVVIALVATAVSLLRSDA